MAWVLACALLLVPSGCGDPATAHELRLSGEALGTTWSVDLVIPQTPAPSQVDEVRERIAATLDRVDRGMSTWREDAELARFNRQSELGTFLFAPETRRVIAAALDLARETGGAFDPTVAPLVALWGFGAQAADTPPTVAQPPIPRPPWRSWRRPAAASAGDTWSGARGADWRGACRVYSSTSRRSPRGMP